MKYVISSTAYNKVESFYTNMWKKFHNDWGLDEIHRLIDKCVDAMFEIEKSLPNRNNILKRWQGLSVAEFKLNRKSS